MINIIFNCIISYVVKYTNNTIKLIIVILKFALNFI